MTTTSHGCSLMSKLLLKMFITPISIACLNISTLIKMEKFVLDVFLIKTYFIVSFNITKKTIVDALRKYHYKNIKTLIAVKN